MSGVPVETVVELLMEQVRQRGHWVYKPELSGSIELIGVRLSRKQLIEAETVDELRAKVREFVETLVRKDGE
jgi:hypothetical protein